MSRHRINLPTQELAEFCRRWNVFELSLFGSALRSDFNEQSDIDFLVTFAPESNWGLLEHVKMRDELAALMGRPVDLVTRRSVESSANWIRRAAILDSAETVYAA